MAGKSILKPFRGIYHGVFRALSKSPVDITMSIRSRSCGFFGDTATTLNGIRFAEMNGIDCAVEWGQRSLYLDPASGPNVWKYAFAESKFAFRGSAKERSIHLPYYPTPDPFPSYQDLSERESLALAISKFCKPTTEITQIVEAYISTNFAPTTLGVHYRGTDAAAGFENRNTTSVQQLEIVISDWLKKNPEGNVFLATDETSAIDKLSERFPGVIHYRECIRSIDGKSVHGHYDDGNSGNGRQKCIEVLVDAILMSKCNLLCARGSRVVWFATSMNPKLELIEIPW